MKVVQLQKLDELVRPVVEGQGYDLVDLSFRREFGHWVLQIMIDRRQGQGGISHEDCVSVSREASVILDINEQLLPADYHLEVSSPGPNRPLKAESDFLRFVGYSAKIKLKEHAAQGGGDGGPPRRHFTGRIQSIQASIVTMELADQQKIVQLNWNDIEKANLFEKNNK